MGPRSSVYSLFQVVLFHHTNVGFHPRCCFPACLTAESQEWPVKVLFYCEPLSELRVLILSSIVHSITLLDPVMTSSSRGPPTFIAVSI